MTHPSTSADAGPRSAAQRKPSLRHARVSVKLALIAVVGVLAAVTGAAFGFTGLRTENSASQELSDIAVTLQAGADLRDMEGDMRVNLHEAQAATDAAQLTAVLAETKDTDASVDQAVGDIRTGLQRAHDTTGAALLDTFAARLSTWRTLRDQQLLPAVRAGDRAAADALVTGALQAANDGPQGFADPLDRLFE